MKIPPWLSGLLMVLVVAAVWWAVSGDDTEKPTDARESPSGQAASPEPGPTPAPPAQDASDDETSSQETAADEASPEETAAQPPEDEVGWPEPTGVDTRPWDDIDACEDSILPATMIPVVEDIWAGGPYDYDRDGIRFGNYEGYLPDEDGGYYREFTVETPGLDHRGARRIVTGGWGESDPDVWYYTEDHYESFCEFAP